MAAIAVRRAAPEDIDEAARLAGMLVRMHHQHDPARFFLAEDVEAGYGWWLRRELARPEAVVMVATSDGAVVGYGYATREERDWNALLDDHGAIHDIFVLPEARRGGLGRRLLDALVAELEALGAQRIVLSTMVDNGPAQALFVAAGFRPTMLEMTRNPRRGCS